jgi:hypothetical protein
MITYTPKTPLEAAVLETGRFELATDTAGREVLSVGHRRLPKVVLQQKSEGLHDLMEALGAEGARAYSVAEGDPWHIEAEESGDEPSTVAAEEYLVMGLRPLMADGRPVRVAAGRDLVRLFLLPWVMPARTLDFGNGPRYVVTSNRGVMGDWILSEGARQGLIVGIPEVWVGILERQRKSDAALVFRCDVPMPWIGDTGLGHATPTMVGVFEVGGASEDASQDDGVGTWVAKLPVLMTEGNVVHPVDLPPDVSAEAVPDGPWELEFQGSSDFSMGALT